MARYRPSRRLGKIGIVVLLALIIWRVWSIIGPVTHGPLSYWAIDPRLTLAQDDPAVDIARMEQTFRAGLAQSAQDLDHEAVSRRFRLNLSRGTMKEYEASLRATWAEFFVGPSLFPPASDEDGQDRPAEWIERIVVHLSLAPHPQPPLRKTIWTTDLLPWAHRSHPTEYAEWLRLNPGWEVAWFVEDDIDRWVSGTFGPNAPIVRIMQEMRQDWGILRSDMFRYLVLLVEGGVYTDSDTGSVRPISEWWDGAVRPAHRQATLPLPPSDSPSFGDLVRGRQWTAWFFGLLFPSSRTSDDEDEPSLLVSPEGACSAGSDGMFAEPHCGQIAAHTILAKPWHPVMLDVLTDGLRAWRAFQGRRSEAPEVAAPGDEAGDPPGVLGWFGPFALSDAVYRWLLVRHGVHPAEVEHIREPRTYGTTTILPPRSFNAWCRWFGDKEQCNAEDTVWHGVAGRWRSKHGS